MFIGENQKENDCSVVAIHNALVWQGKKTPYKAIEKVAKKTVRYTKEGLFMEDLPKLLETVSVDYRTVPSFTISEIESRVLNGNAILINYWQPGAYAGHLVMAYPGEGRTIKILNSDYTWVEIIRLAMRKELKIQIWNLGWKSKNDD